MTEESAEASLPSRVQYVYDNEQQQQRRQGHLMALLPLERRDSVTGERALQEFRVYVELSAFLAYKHVQRRSAGEVLPHLAELLSTCDFDWTYRHHDTQFSPLQAARELVSYDVNLELNGVSVNGSSISSSISSSSSSSSSSISTPMPTEQPPNNSSSSNLWWDVSLPSPSVTPQRTSRTTAPARTNIPLAVPLLTLSPGENVDQEEGERQQPQSRKKRQLQLQQDHRQQQQQQQQQLKVEPFAVLGAARSVVSQAVSILGAAWELPQISSSSTASTLDDSPFFARTVPTNEGDAHATILYLSQQLHVTHAAVVFLNDDWGRRYEQDLRMYASRYGVTLRSVPMGTSSDSEIEQAMVQLQQTNLSYFIGILPPSDWKPVVLKAYQFGLMGSTENTWFLGDLVEIVGDGFALNREKESDLANALHGTGVVLLKVKPHPAFDQALADVASNPVLQQEFIASHSNPEILENFDFSASPGRSLFQYLTYDAMIALGITACETPGLFTGREFYNELLKVDFEGVSGRVLLHETTGTRLGDSLQYEIVNLVRSDFQNTATTSSETISFDSHTASLIELSPETKSNASLSAAIPVIQTVQPFVYHDNGTVPPLSLPYLEEDLNLIPNGILYTGLAMGIAVMLLSFGFGIWTYTARNSYVVRASQPVFLIQLCVGTFIVAATVIPLGWQEPRPGLDAACVAIPWLFCIGYVFAISSLFAKAKRINQLINQDKGFRRIRVKPQDVMRPCIILMSINVVLLTAWSASPWRMSWHRVAVENNVDQFGRSVESYGGCRPDSNWHFLLTFPLTLSNAIVLAMATYQSYRARDLPTELSETLYLSISLVSLSETFLLGITVIFAVKDQPTAFYMVCCVVLFLGCLSFLLPVFLPKYLQRNQTAPRGRNTTLVVLRHNQGSGFCTGVSAHGSGMSMHGNGLLGSDTGRPSLSRNSAHLSSVQAIRAAAAGGPSLLMLDSSKSLPLGSKHTSSNSMSLLGSEHANQPVAAAPFSDAPKARLNTCMSAVSERSLDESDSSSFAG